MSICDWIVTIGVICATIIIACGVFEDGGDNE